jgi:hypothetical protein
MTDQPPFDPPFDHRDDPDDMVFVDELADLGPTDEGCTWCLGGFAPAGTHPIIGLVYVACIHCTDTCHCCNGTGLFPADTTCNQCLLDALAVLGYTAVFCHTCTGVLTVHPATEVTT